MLIVKTVNEIEALLRGVLGMYIDLCSLGIFCNVAMVLILV